jgi:hypothetical protein
LSADYADGRRANATAFRALFARQKLDQVQTANDADRLVGIDDDDAVDVMLD